MQVRERRFASRGTGLNLRDRVEAAVFGDVAERVAFAATSARALVPSRLTNRPAARQLVDEDAIDDRRVVFLTERQCAQTGKPPR